MTNFESALSHLDPYEVRDVINDRIMSLEASTPDVHSIIDHTIAREERTTKIRLYTPNDETNLPMILMIHGGAWVGGNLDTHDNMARYLCSKAKAIVVSVGYVNAPEGKFPLPLEQSYDVLLWMKENASFYNAKASMIGALGDGSGANMAAALCLLARDRKGPSLALQVLINPFIDLRIKHDMMSWYISQYVNAGDETHPYASPILSQDLSHLPPALIILAEHDILCKSGQSYAEKLQLASSKVNTYLQEGIGHLAGNVARASLLAQESLDVAVAFLCDAFRKK